MTDRALDDLTGLGFFYASADMARSPDTSAARCAQAGASWAMVLAESVDGRIQPLDRVVGHVRALRRAGVRPLIYTFPDPREAARGPEALRIMVRRAINRAQITSVPHVCLDFEPFQGADWGAAQIDAAVRQVQATGLRASVTVFSRPRWSRIVWPPVPVILQVYERARSPELLEGALAAWPAHAVIPAIGTYLGDVARLRSDLANLANVANVANVAQTARGLAVWALATTDRAERAALRAHAR